MLPFIKELLLSESTYQQVGDERYFVHKDDYEYVVDHLTIHPAATDTLFRRVSNDIFEFEIDVSLTMKVYTLKGILTAVGGVEGQLKGLLQESAGRVGLAKDGIDMTDTTSFRRLRGDSPFKDELTLWREAEKALASNMVFLKTTVIRYLTSSKSNWKEFLELKLKEIKDDEAIDEPLNFDD